MGHLNGLFGLKKPYRTKAAAKKARKASRQQRADNLTPYECFVCRMWHLGNKVPVGTAATRIPPRGSV